MYGKTIIIGVVALAGTAGFKGLARNGGDATLQVVRSTEVPVNGCTTGERYVTTRSLAVRAHPPDGDVVGALPRNVRVLISGCTGDWARVGNRLWVQTEYLARPAPDGAPDF